MRTRLLLILFVAFAVSSCSVEPLEDELNQNQITEFNSEIEDYGCAGPDNAKTITFSEAQAIESWNEVRKLYLSLLSPEVPRNGTFDPSIWNIINEFQAKGIGDYSTEYSLTGDCSDQVVLTISVIADPLGEDPCAGFTGGENNSTQITISEATAIPSWDEVRKLYLSLLAPGVPRNGTFDPSIWDVINKFNGTEDKLGDYTVTYTINNGECTASVELTVTVIADFSDPVCEGVNAGEDNMREITRSEAEAIPSWDEVRKLYLSLLAPGVPRNGTFDPSIWDIINKFNETEDNLGDYTTTYTVTDEECSDTVQLTIRVVAD